MAPFPDPDELQADPEPVAPSSGSVGEDLAWADVDQATRQSGENAAELEALERLAWAEQEVRLAHAGAEPSVRLGPATPVMGAERVDLIDSMRGFAVFGILLMNMSWFAWPPIRHFGTFVVHYASSLDAFMDLSLRFLAEGKFYIIFSFLFGMGMAVQKERVEVRGAAFFPFFLRRMFWLLVIGLVHGYFIWSGDILATYALTGGTLLIITSFWGALAQTELKPLTRLCGNSSPASLLAWALLLMAMVMMMVMGWAEQQRTPADAFADAVHEEHFSMANYERDLMVYKYGSYDQITEKRINETNQLLSGIGFLGILVMTSYLFGAFAWRMRLFTDIAGHRTLLRRVFLFGGAMGLVSNALYIGLDHLYLPQSLNLAGFVAHYFGQYSLGYTYLAGLALLYESGHCAAMFRYLAPVGRMALTNYLTHSVVFTLVFNGYGLGLMAEFGEAQIYLMAFVMYALQIVLSSWWMQRFRFGPVEWLWRTLTYLRFQPMRRMHEVLDG